jgi:hypothetical protein
VSKLCKYCKALGHTAFGCRRKPKKPLKAKQPLSQAGKLAKAYALLRETFFTENKGPYYCIYCLALGIRRELTKGQVNIEHYYSKARRPDLRFKKENLVVSCSEHNRLKGSLDGDEFIRKIGGQVGN